MRRRTTIIHFCMAFLLTTTNIFGVSVPEERQTDRLNILWICADDFSPDFSGNGTKAVSTPNLDRLNATSLTFQNAFATSPVCSPSRSAFVTGMYQTSIGAHHHRTHARPKLPNQVKTIMEILKDAGYFVTNQGKTDYNFESSFSFSGTDWSQRKPGQPFFAQVQIKEPHRAFVKNKRLDRLDSLEFPPYYPDHPVTRADWANYLASVEVMDRRVGEILDRLDRENLSDNTVVFFFGDHGRPHLWDKQWLYEGGIKVPLFIRIPNRQPEKLEQLASLIDLAPTTLSLAGLAVPANMQGIDLLDNQKQREFIFAARDRAGDATDRIRCIRNQRYKLIRNDDDQLPYFGRSSYKQLQYPVAALLKTLENTELTSHQLRFMEASKPKIELYDLILDPWESNNLATHPEHQDVLASLNQKLTNWENATRDFGRFREMSDIEMKRLIQSKQNWYRQVMKKRGLAGATPDELVKWWESQLGITDSDSPPTANPDR